MMYYYGMDLLDKMSGYYGSRLCTAQKRGFDSRDNAFYWLYDELLLRVKILRQARAFLTSLPAFMRSADEQELFRYVMDYVSAFFDGVEDQNDYFSQSDPYWVQFQECMDEFGIGYSTKILPLAYVDFTECVVRSLRMYFYIREHEHTPIDRERFDALMEACPKLAPADERG